MSCLLLSLLSTVFYIGNQWIAVGITDQTQSVRAGSISYFLDRWSGDHIAEGAQFSGINTGSFIPADGEITLVNDSCLIFHTDHFTDGSSTMPIDLQVTYRVINRGLEMSYRVEYLEDVEFWSPFEIDFHIGSWNNIQISNQSAVDEEFPLDGTSGYQRFSGDQLFDLSAGDVPDALFILPNTSKGIVAVNDDGNPYLSVLILDTENPRENCDGPILHSIVPAGQVDEYFIRFTLDEYFAPVFIGGLPEGAERSAGWMLDELPLIHPSQGDIWGFSETSEGDEGVSAGLISLLDDHSEMKMNWLILPDGILTPNRDSVWFEPGYEDSWSHWHGTWRISTEATSEYLEWLKNIQDNVYPWANRVRMGSHGYHHTPNPDSSFGSFHEFITYEPLEHQERFRMNFLDLNDCGLDSNLVRVIRFSGHRTSLSGLQAIIDHGFTFYCNGWRVNDWFAGTKFHDQWITKYQTANGRIWGSNSVWWGDFQMMYPTEWLAEVMEKGKFGLLGCHPISMLGVVGASWSPEAYARIDSILYSIENDYDNFIWLFPEEYGDYLEDCFNIRVNSMRSNGDELELGVTGSFPEGLTFCADLHPDDVVLDVMLNGTTIPWELRSGGRLFAIAPATSYGDHIVFVSIDSMGMKEGPGEYTEQGVSIHTQSPSPNGIECVSVFGVPPGNTFEIRVMDLTGRVVSSQSEISLGSVHSIGSGEPLPSGVYLITVLAGDTMASTKAVILQ